VTSWTLKNSSLETVGEEEEEVQHAVVMFGIIEDSQDLLLCIGFFNVFMRGATLFRPLWSLFLCITVGAHGANLIS
jgi:hypothetical protein